MTADIIAFLSGALVPIWVYRQTGWWLGSVAGVAMLGTLLVCTGVLTALLTRRTAAPLTWWVPALLADTTSIATSTGILLRVGTGALFPIVLAIVHIICTACTFGGAAVIIIPRLRRRPQASDSRR